MLVSVLQAPTPLPQHLLLCYFCYPCGSALQWFGLLSSPDAAFLTLGGSEAATPPGFLPFCPLNYSWVLCHHDYKLSLSSVFLWIDGLIHSFIHSAVQLLPLARQPYLAPTQRSSLWEMCKGEHPYHPLLTGTTSRSGSLTSNHGLMGCMLGRGGSNNAEPVSCPDPASVGGGS